MKQEEKNVFRDAKFGDKFLTRNGQVMIYQKQAREDVYCLFDEEGDCVIEYRPNGDVIYDYTGDAEPQEDDIVKKYVQPSLPSDLDEAAELFNREDAARMWDYESKTEGEIVESAFKAGAELVISELFEKLKITPLKVIGKDEYGYPVYDFEVGHYYRTFTLFGEKYKCDQTDSGKAGEQMLAGQGYTRECTVDRTPLNGPAGICLNLHEYDGFKLGDSVIVQIRKKD